MEKYLLLEVLDVFKSARKKLISDFVNEEELEIFIPLFKYENNENLMSIALERYFIIWINYHFFLVENKKSQNKKVLIKQMIKFINIYSISDEKKNGHTVTMDLLIQKQKVLNDLLQLDDKSKIDLKKLLYHSQKDKALFDRKIKQMEEN